LEETVNLGKFSNTWYQPSKFKTKIWLWYFVNAIFLKNSLNPFSGVKVFMLRLFGAKIGSNVIVKQCINVKYPWFLSIGDDSWIGENVWIDNLASVVIGSNVCISQGALLLTGNHDYKKSTFDLMLAEIILEDGVWIGAQSTVGPGVKCCTHSILTVGSVATKNLESYTINQGNPAVCVNTRKIKKN
jgi:putative colanic acid biosynthesis acetyltransferase WcaF